MNISVDGVDFSKHIESISWSGDENQLARKVTISYLYAPDSKTIHNVAAGKGGRLIMTESGRIWFDGIIVTEERSESGITMQNMAYDYAWYLRSKAMGVYKGSPGTVAAMVCGENGIPCGSIYDPGGEVEIISTGEKSISQVVKEAYVTDGSYKSSIENMVNKVVLLDAADQPVGEVSNGMEQYGTIRDAYKISGSELDPLAEAEKLLKGIEESGKIVVKGYPDFQTGKAVIVEKVNSKIRGRFVIISDSHTIRDAEHTATLGLRFDTVA